MNSNHSNNSFSVPRRPAWHTWLVLPVRGLRSSTHRTPADISKEVASHVKSACRRLRVEMLGRARQELSAGPREDDKPGWCSIEKLRASGELVIEVAASVEGKETPMGISSTRFAAAAVPHVQSFVLVKDPRTGLKLPQVARRPERWNETLQMAEHALQLAEDYAQLGVYVSQAASVWDDALQMESLAGAISTLMDSLQPMNKSGPMAPYLHSLIWPLLNGHVVEDGADPDNGCWVFTQLAAVMERSLELQGAGVARISTASMPEQVAGSTPVLSRAERKALKRRQAVSLRAGAGPVPQPEAKLQDPETIEKFVSDLQAAVDAPAVNLEAETVSPQAATEQPEATPVFDTQALADAQAEQERRAAEAAAPAASVTEDKPQTAEAV